MFTGIIKSIGEVKKVDANLLQIEHDLEVNPGDSIAVNGVCLTLNEKGSFDIMDETLNCTNLGEIGVGDRVNLESGMAFGDKVDGHMVSGHVDFVANVLSFDGEILRVSFPSDYGKFFALKGSVSINGVSLTISKIENDSFEVSLVDFTLKNTNLGTLNPENKVNIEVDLIARYLERIVSNSNTEL